MLFTELYKTGCGATDKTFLWLDGDGGTRSAPARTQTLRVWGETPPDFRTHRPQTW